MSRKNRQSDDRQDLRLPGTLVEDLNRLCEPPSSVPEDVDRAIFDHAWQRCEVFTTKRRIRRWGAVGAAAAGIALILWVGEMSRRIDQPYARAVAGMEDIDRNGRVDILDAFTLARAIDGGGTLSQKWDINLDGEVDRADVDEIAAAAVSLKPQTQQRRGA